MRDKSSNRQEHSTTLPRRALVGGCVGFTGATLLGAPAYAAEGPAARGLQAVAERGAGARHIRLHRFAAPLGLLLGNHSGVRPTLTGLVLHRPTSTRTYADPFAGGASATYDSGSWTSPVLQDTFGATEAIASWDVDTPGRTWVEVLVRGVDETGARTGWFVMGRWCREDPAAGGGIFRTSVDDQGTDVATVYTDTLSTKGEHTLRGLQLQVNLMRPQGSSLSPVVRQLTLMCTALPDEESVPVSAHGPRVGRVLSVPTYSQEIHRGQYPQWNGGGEAWCSATSSAMVADYWRRGPSRSELSWVTPMQDPQVAYAARNTFDYTYDGCGNWPFNAAYLACNGLRGFVTRLRSLREAEQFVAAGIPLITSQSFEKGELTGAGYGTNGHLMVLRGFDRTGNPVMNDPASHLLGDDGQVRVTYDRAQFENAWLTSSGGTVYVVHPVTMPLPRTGREANW